mmetsp:Transcript_5486/g.18146  ORF Transcript_5486/g.18146 Transcript_5486/m.18146 type:complete len:375 (+) Transcript_5486:1-1125(+)
MATAHGGDAPITIIDVVDGVARVGYAVDGASVRESPISRATVVRERGCDGDAADGVVHAVDAHGRVSNVDALEVVLRDALYGALGWAEGFEGYACACERATTTLERREDVTRMMFEEFNVAGLAFVDAAVGALYACGRISGVSVEITENASEVTCALEGAALTQTWRRAPRGGKRMDRALRAAIMAKQGVDVSDDTARAIRLALGKCAESREEYEAFKSDSAACETETFKLPDGGELKLTSELYECGEVLMQDALGADESDAEHDHHGSLPAEICESVQKCPFDVRQLIVDNIVVHGEGSKLPGLEARLLVELQSRMSLVPSMTSIPEYMPASTYAHAPWTGAAIASKVIFSSNQYISKTDYNENGPAFAHSRR